MNSFVREHLSRLDAHAPGEGDHGERVAVYAVAVAERLGQSDEELQLLRVAAALHDLGKLDLPTPLLNATRPLLGKEVLKLRQHPELGSHRLQEWPEVATIVAAHHERIDGLGYPFRLAKDQIPLMARIIAVAEAFDTLTAIRSWRTPLHEDEALLEIQRNVGRQFDGTVVAAFLEIQPRIQPIELK